MSIDQEKLLKWRADNAKNFNAFSIILHSRIKDRLNDPARIEWLTKIDVCLAIDREVYVSFNFEFPLVISENLDQVIKKMKRNRNHWKLKKSHIKTLSRLKKHTVELKKISDCLEDKEFIHHQSYVLSGDFFLLLNSSATCATNYNPEEIKKVTKLLQIEYKTIVSMRKEILKKSYGLRDCINDNNFSETTVKINALKKQIHEMVLGTSFEGDVIKEELVPKIVELNGYVKKFGEFLKDKKVAQFTGVDKFVDALEESLYRLSEAFLETLISNPPSPTNSQSTTASYNSSSSTDSSIPGQNNRMYIVNTIIFKSTNLFMFD